MLCLASFATSLVLASATGKSEPRPNFVLCMADDQGYGEVGYQGHPVLQTPQIDAMAQQGLRLDRFYAAAPVCSPTRASVLTGRHPIRMGCFSWGHCLQPAEVTLAEALREAGYATGHFGKWHVGSVTAGSVYSPGANGFDEWLSSPNFYENDPQFSHRGEVVRRKGESSAVTVEAALEFMRRCSEQQRPFLAVVWFGSPHRPHQATAELLAAYASEEQSMQHFYGELAGIDAAMGELRKGLRDLDLVDRTLLWYTSDNGGLHESSSPGLRGRKGDLDEGGLRVPCVLEWPGVVAAGQVSSCVSGTVDIFPTVLQLAQVELQPQPQLDGESLVDLLRGEDWRRSEPLGFWVVPADGRPMHSNRILEALQRGEALETSAPLQVPPWLAKGELPGSAAWLSGDLKLHRRWSEDGAVHDELYDLSSDPGEQQDRSAERPALLNTLRQELQVWQQSVLASLRQHLAAEGS